MMTLVGCIVAGGPIALWLGMIFVCISDHFARSKEYKSY